MKTSVIPAIWLRFWNSFSISLKSFVKNDSGKDDRVSIIFKAGSDIIAVLVTSPIGIAKFIKVQVEPDDFYQFC